jgi:hypothetical protein
LSEHPGVFVPENKEPNFWADEIEPAPRSNNPPIKDWEDYLRLYRAAQPQHRVRIDSSTSYLSSATAVKRIVHWNPKAKFIAMVRNPIMMAVSLHNEEYHSFHEDISDFEVAWQLQEERKKRQAIPPLCDSPARLQYREIASLGTQLVRLFELTHPSHRHVVVLDDLAEDPRAVYLSVLDFLNLADDGRSHFPRANPARRYRSRAAARLLLYPPKLLFPLVAVARTVAWSIGLKGARSGIARLAEVSRKAPLPSPSVLRQLAVELEEEVRTMERVLQRDFSHWLAV